MGEMRTKFWFESLKRRDNSAELGVHGRMIFKCILGKQGLEIWIGFMCLTTGTGSGIL
jgi:hypothetical protein